jgi:ABC-type dipeptide/oligopeptide/nickel transport system ATPase component
MRQRVRWLIALMCRPQLLLADDAHDGPRRQRAGEGSWSCCGRVRSRGIGILIITPSTSVCVAAIADRVAVHVCGATR